MQDFACIQEAVAAPDFVHAPLNCIGPPLWRSIHNLCRTFVPTPEKQVAMRAFMGALGVLFPCPTCAAHIREAVKTMPVNSTAALVKWSIDFHNDVNARTGKRVWSYADALVDMAKMPPALPGTCSTWNTAASAFCVCFVVATIAAVVAGVLLFQKKYNLKPC